jgi:hypothetical protein
VKFWERRGKMEFNTFYNKIQTDETMMETIQHGNSEYPFQLYYDDLALFDFHCVALLKISTIMF